MTELDVTVRFRSDLHIGSGLGRGREIDSAVLRDQNGVVYLPGSTVKGLARTALRTLLASEPLKNLPACAGVPYKKGEIAVEELAGREFRGLCGETEPEQTDRDPPCVLCRLFGATGRQAGVAFGNGYPDDSIPSSGGTSSRVLARRAMRSRRTGTAEDKALFTEELAEARTFRLTLEPTGEVELDDRDWLLLAAALRSIREMGGGRRRGHGACEVKVEFVGGAWDGERLPVPDHASGEAPLRDAIQDLLEKGTTVESGPGERPASAPPSDGGRTGSRWPATATGTREGEESAPGIRTLALVAVAREPLALARRPDAGNKLDTQPYVPGSSIRGAIAWKLIREWDLGEDAHENPVFEDCFLEEHLRFGPLYPAFVSDGELAVGAPMPRSAITCRDHPGFPADGGHGVVDRLRAGEEAVDAECPSCGGRLRPKGGFYSVPPDGESGGAYRSLEVPGRTRYQTAVDDDTGRPKENQLFGARLVEAGTVFVGHVWGPATQLSVVKELFIGDSGVEIRVGRGRSRGRGRLELQLADGERQERIFPYLFEPPDDRLRGEGEDSIGESFTLTLHSDLIGLDPWLHPVGTLDGPALWRLLGGDGADPPFELDWAYADTRRVQGWRGKPGLPRSADTAIVRGSSFRYVLKDGASVEEAGEVTRLLQQAEREGLGLRRGEGFGVVVVNQPLHQHLDWIQAADAEIGCFAGGVVPDARLEVPDHLSIPGSSGPGEKGGLAEESRQEPENVDRFYRQLGEILQDGGVRLLRRAAHHPGRAADIFRDAAEALSKERDDDVPSDWKEAENVWGDVTHERPRRMLIWWGLAQYLRDNCAEATTDEAEADRIRVALLEFATETARRLTTVRTETDG